MHHLTLGEKHSNFCLATETQSVRSWNDRDFKFEDVKRTVPAAPRFEISPASHIEEAGDAFCGACLLIHSFMRANGVTSPMTARILMRKANR